MSSIEQHKSRLKILRKFLIDNGFKELVRFKGNLFKTELNIEIDNTLFSVVMNCEEETINRWNRFVLAYWKQHNDSPSYEGSIQLSVEEFIEVLKGESAKEFVLFNLDLFVP